MPLVGIFMDLFKIRFAKIEDAEQLGRIHILTWKSTFVGIVSDEYLESLSLDKVTQRFSEQIQTPLPHSKILVAVDHLDSAIGYSACGPNRLADSFYTGEVQAFFVLQSWQGKGVGRKLLEESLLFLKRSEFESVIIWTFEANQSAKAFYRSNGGSLVLRRIREIAGRQTEEVGFGYNLNEVRKLIDFEGLV
jgi:GNAT superfamily N-acetyltransferase